MPDYSPEDLVRALQAQGFSGDALRTATAIGLTENGARQLNAISPTNDYGPMQINLPTWGHIFSASELLTLAGGARATKYIYDLAGKKFNDWTTFTGGAYTANLPAADSAILSVSSGGVFGTGGGNILGLPSIPNLNPIGPVTDGVTKLVDLIKVPIDLIVKILTYLTASKHWWEMGFILVGIAMIGTGFILYFHNEAENVAKVAAVA